MSSKELIEGFELRPKRLFLIDGLGALVSAFLLGIVLVRFERLFGIPSGTLYFLAIWPGLFAMYDFYCYNAGKYKLGHLLQGISIMNFLYCGLSIGLALYHIKTIRGLGWLYILIEVLMVITLAMIELRVGRNLIRKTTPV